METEELTPNKQEGKQEEIEESVVPSTEEGPLEKPEPALEPVSEPEPETELEPEPKPEGELEPVEEGEPEPEVPVEEVPQMLPDEEVEQRPSFLKRMMHFLFSSDTRVGRFMRPFLRTAALIVVMFAAGVLVSYFTLYRPLSQQRDQLVQQVQELNQEMQDTNNALEKMEAELGELQATSEETIKDLGEEVGFANFRIYFLIAKNDVLRARLALLDEEEGPGGPKALAALNELENHLDDLLPFVEEVDPVLAGLLQDRLKVVKGELVRDGQQAKIELDSFYTNLLELEDTLFD